MVQAHSIRSYCAASFLMEFFSIVITSSGALMVDERSLGSYELEEDAAVIVPWRAHPF